MPQNHSPSSTTPRRLAALRQRMRQTGTDLVALAPGAHLEWLGVRLHPEERPCFLFVTQENATFLMPLLNAGWFEEIGMGRHLWNDTQGPSQALQAALSEVDAQAARTIALDEKMRADFVLLLLAALPNAKPRTVADTLGVLRMHKDEAELEKLKNSARLADRILLETWSSLRIGMTEQEIGHGIRERFLATGADPKFWIVGSGPNSAFAHSVSGSRRLSAGDVVLIDIGARLEGYYSDITRMCVMGHPPEGYPSVHVIVEEAVSAAMDVARPGVSAREVDQAARAVIEQAGYGQYFPHRLGHGLGIDEHEPPYLAQASDHILREDMVFTIEPGIYLPGRFGIRLEELVVLRRNGPEPLSSLPRTVRVIPE